MMSMAAHIAEACRWFVLIVLGLAAGGKTLHFAAFREGLAESFPRLGRISTPMAMLIVGAEWTTAALILGDGTVRIGLLAALLLFLLFATVIAVSRIRGDTIVCQCFGAAGHRVSAFDLWRNLLYIAATACSMHYLAPTSSIDPASHLTLFGLAFIAFLISTALQDIVLLLRVRVED